MFKRKYLKYNLTGGTDKTAFIGLLNTDTRRQNTKLLLDRHFKITKEWSPKREGHLILIKTSLNVNWNTIESECRLINHMPFSPTITNKVEFTKLVLKHKLKNCPYSVNDVNEIKNYKPVKNFGNELWIAKQGTADGGKMIKLFHKKDMLKFNDKLFTIQKYLESPCLLNGYKFDFRICVLMTQEKVLYIHPVYIVRLAHSKYTLDNLDLDVHLTNVEHQKRKGYDINKAFLTKDEFEREFKRETNIIMKAGKIMADIFDVLKPNDIKTDNYFACYGADFILDKDLNLYFIEINNSLGFGWYKDGRDVMHPVMEQAYNLTIDKVFDGKYIKTDFIKLKDYTEFPNYNLTGGTDRTAFIGWRNPINIRHHTELLLARHFRITEEWSPKREDHLILHVTSLTIRWDTIGTECRLLNHMPFSQKLANKIEFTKLVLKNKRMLSYCPYSVNDTEGIKNYKPVKNFGNDLWIMKQGTTAGGKLIQLLHKKDALKFKRKLYTIQKYLERPCLLNGYKFDFRIYVLITQNKTLYIHPFYEVRIAHSKYTLIDLNLDNHLTNLSYQKSKGYDTIGKRLIKDEFEREFKQETNIIAKVGQIMIDVFDAMPINNTDNYFELYGVDVILDEDLNPYLLEFNNNPDFTMGGSNYDKHHKLLTQVYNLTIDKVFDGKDIKTDFIKLKDYTNQSYNLTGGTDKTVFLGKFGTTVTRHLTELLLARHFRITKEWSPKRAGHLIINKTSSTINWNTINTDCRLVNHMPFSQTLANKVEFTELVLRHKSMLKYNPYSVNDVAGIKRYNKTKNFGDDLWIIKHGKLWGGQQIQLLHKRDIINFKDKHFTIQKYLEYPCLLNGYKFDFRIYVLMTQDKKLYIHPFYEVRIAHSKYTLDDLDLDIHLTNLTHQKLKGYDTTGKRMTKHDFEREFKHKINIIKEVGGIVKETFSVIKTEINNVKTDTYFELYGVDIILDKDLNPYILEFNNNPGFSLGGGDYGKHHALLDQTYNLTVDKVFDGKKIKTDFILLKDYGI